MEIGNRMDAVQKQIIALSHKVDALYQMLEQTNRKVSEAVTEIKQSSRSEVEQSSVGTSFTPQGYQRHRLLDSVMEHKDILVEGKNEMTNSYQDSETALAPDIQVQRLTAQLTAAYNRIAALEEQLLARRFTVKN